MKLVPHLGEESTTELIPLTPPTFVTEGTLKLYPLSPFPFKEKGDGG
jgi:hypothetical protein